MPDMLPLIGFTIAGLAISILIAKVGQLAAEQAALRRVATQVAHAVPAEELFAAAARETGRLVGADYVCMSRRESGDLIAIAAWDRTGKRVRAGRPWPVIRGFFGALFRIGRSGRIDDIAVIDPSLADVARAHGVRWAAAVPIMVGGHSWGVMLSGSTMRWALLPSTEHRMTAFADLLGAAISNAESRAGLSCLAQEQAALRRVATLVAREEPPENVFTAVTEEAGHLVQAEITSMLSATRLTAHQPSWLGLGREARGSACQSATGNRSAGDGDLGDFPSRPVGPLWRRLRRTGGAPCQGLAFRSAVGAPIIVDGRLWGAVLAATTDARALSPFAETRIGSFTDLVATAVSNAENRAQLVASRARVLAAADDARRQIERDLHDGAQQRLISLTLAVREAQAAVPLNSGQLGESCSVAEGLNSVLDDLREGARIHPTIPSAGWPSPGAQDTRSPQHRPRRTRPTAGGAVAGTGRGRRLLRDLRSPRQCGQALRRIGRPDQR